MLKPRAFSGRWLNSACSSVDTTCLPVHMGFGSRIAGGRVGIRRDGSEAKRGRDDTAAYTSCWYWSRFKNVSRLVSRTPMSMWSWMRPRNGSPFVGTQ